MTTANGIRRSPLHHLLEPLDPEWKDFAGAPIAWQFQQVEVERAAMRDLGLCDLSPLPKLGVSGPAAANWLQEQRIAAMQSIYDTQRLADGGWAVRTGAEDFFFESGSACSTVPALDTKLGRGTMDVVRVERQEATFLVTGTRALELFSQTCAFDFREAAPQRAVMTRIAGVSCIVLPEGDDTIAQYRIWLDSSYAVSLWESLYEICTELGGQLIGAEAVDSSH